MKTHACPVCEEVYPAVQGLAAHLLTNHLRNNVCWCGWIIQPPPWDGPFSRLDHLLAHADRHGGITAHYHAVLLGID